MGRMGRADWKMPSGNNWAFVLSDLRTVRWLIEQWVLLPVRLCLRDTKTGALIVTLGAAARQFRKSIQACRANDGILQARGSVVPLEGSNCYERVRMKWQASPAVANLFQRFVCMGEGVTAPLPAHLHGSFFPTSNRKALDASVALNRLLLSEGAKLAARSLFWLANLSLDQTSSQDDLLPAEERARCGRPSDLDRSRQPRCGQEHAPPRPLAHGLLADR